MAQQKTRNGICPSCNRRAMRSGQGAHRHGKVDGVMVCDDCYVSNSLNRYKRKG